MLKKSIICNSTAICGYFQSKNLLVFISGDTEKRVKQLKHNPLFNKIDPGLYHVFPKML